MRKPDDKLQTRPRLVDRANLHVDEPARQCDVAHDILGHVGRHLRRPLGPRDPDHPCGRELGLQAGQATLELTPLTHEEHGEVEVRARPCEHADTIGQLAQERREVLRRSDEDGAHPRLEAELARQRGAGVASRQVAHHAIMAHGLR